jgi:serine/threonine protein kinase
VVIKAVAKGNEGLRELKILQLLNSEPLKSEPDNATVPVLEFLDYGDWHFVVMPFYDGSDERPFLNAVECLEFTEQVLSVSLSAHFPYIFRLLNSSLFPDLIFFAQ